MATPVRTDHPFFLNDESGFQGERETIQSIYDEANWLHGSECIYIPHEMSGLDEVFGEYLQKLIVEGIEVRMIVDEYEEDFFNEDNSMYSKFGFVPDVGTSTFHGSKNYLDHFNINPQVQDLIYYKKVKKLFEISHVQLLDDYRYKISATLYNYDHTKIDDSVTNSDILSLDDLADQEQININDKIEEQVETEDIIDDDLNDGLFD